METFIEAKPFVNNPNYYKKRKRERAKLDGLINFSSIDAPIIDIVEGFKSIRHCFTLQSCYGHFVHEKQKDKNNLEPISKFRDIDSLIEYRIAYMAWCIQNNELGRRLFDDLKAVGELEPEYIQFGSANWFWERCVNSYVLQIEPERAKYEDSINIGIEESLKIEKIRIQFFNELEKIVLKHQK